MLISGDRSGAPSSTACTSEADNEAKAGLLRVVSENPVFHPLPAIGPHSGQVITAFHEPSLCRFSANSPLACQLIGEDSRDNLYLN